MKLYIVIWLLIALSSSFFITSANATADEPWRIILFDRQNNSILAVTPDGISETWETPENVVEIVLSPAEDFAALTFTTTGYFEFPYYAPEIVIFDLVSGDCCQPIATQEMFIEIFEGNEGGFRIGGFNDSGTLLAINYVYYDESRTYQDFPIPQTGIAVIDSQTNNLTMAKPTSSRFAGWFGDGVATYPTMQSAGGIVLPAYDEFEFRAWDPVTDENTPTGYRAAIIPPNDLYDLGDFLVTGEQIVASFIPLSEEDQTPTTISARYARYSTGEESYPVWLEIGGGFHSRPTNAFYPIARWIVDGTFVYNRVFSLSEFSPTDQVTILSRSGETQTVEIPSFDQFLTGTPDGWLALRRLGDQSTIIHYVYENGAIRSEEITLVEPNVVLLKRIELGHSIVDPVPFPEVAPPRVSG